MLVKDLITETKYDLAAILGADHPLLIESELIDEGWKQNVLAAMLGTSLISGAIDKFQDNDAKQNPAVAQTTQKVMKLPDAARPLAQAATKAGMSGAELAQFIAQCDHESLNFSRMQEMGSPRYFAQHYDIKHNPGKAKILGNVHAGDGVKFKGRGYIQITGRYNYRKAGEALGLPLEQHPEMVENPAVAAQVAVWFWQHRVKRNVSDLSDTHKVTKKINSGMHGIKSRVRKFSNYLTQV